MVVLTIIGLMLGMATLSGGGNEQKQEAQQQAFRFIAQLNSYRDEAVIQNIDLGLAMDGQSTQLLKYIDVNNVRHIEGKTQEEITQLKEIPWGVYEGNLKNSTELPEQLSMGLILEDKEINFTDLIGNKGVRPAVLFLSSDEYTPFKVTLRNQYDESFSIIIVGDGFSRFQMETK
ncbi:MAG: general secretion pathway protein H [Oleispira sp.]|jgi:general secretion pathway protein H